MISQQPVRSQNERRALAALFREGGMSRAELARVLDLNRSTTGAIVGTLSAHGLVMESAAPATLPRLRTGRPGILVALNPDGASFVGMDIGVDRLTLVAIDLGGRTVSRSSRALRTRSVSPEEVIATAVSRLRGFLRAMPTPAPLRGLCVTVPALVQDGVVRNAAMLGWRDVPLRHLFELALGAEIPVRVENDANGFAVAETYRDASAQADVVAFLRIENGAGAGLVIDGRLFRGASGYAGEFGQFVVDADGAGRLENHIGKDAVLSRFCDGDLEDRTLENLLAALQAGDSRALAAAAKWGHWLARGLHGLTSLINPSRIVLGGSVAALYPYVAGAVTQSLREALMSGFPEPEIVVSRLGSDGAALGGALLLHQLMFSGEAI